MMLYKIGIVFILIGLQYQNQSKLLQSNQVAQFPFWLALLQVYIILKVVSIFEASQRYQSEGTDLVVLAGSQYGTGSSRDWAAKGTLLLGVRAVIATSFERIHRSNLVGMGVLPLTFIDGEDADLLGLDGTESFNIPADMELVPLSTIDIQATKNSGELIKFKAIVRLDTPVEVDYYNNGGILQTVLRNLAKE